MRGWARGGDPGGETARGPAAAQSPGRVWRGRRGAARTLGSVSPCARQDGRVGPGTERAFHSWRSQRVCAVPTRALGAISGGHRGCWGPRRPNLPQQGAEPQPGRLVLPKTPRGKPAAWAGGPALARASRLLQPARGSPAGRMCPPPPGAPPSWLPSGTSALGQAARTSRADGSAVRRCSAVTTDHVQPLRDRGPERESNLPRVTQQREEWEPDPHLALPTTPTVQKVGKPGELGGGRGQGSPWP